MSENERKIAETDTHVLSGWCVEVRDVRPVTGQLTTVKNPWTRNWTRSSTLRKPAIDLFISHNHVLLAEIYPSVQEKRKECYKKSADEPHTLC